MEVNSSVLYNLFLYIFLHLYDSYHCHVMILFGSKFSVLSKFLICLLIKNVTKNTLCDHLGYEIGLQQARNCLPLFFEKPTNVADQYF